AGDHRLHGLAAAAGEQQFEVEIVFAENAGTLAERRRRAMPYLALTDGELELVGGERAARQSRKDKRDGYFKCASHRQTSPHTSRATSTTRASFASWSASPSGFPLIELAKPHCGLSASCSSGAKRAASA